MMRRILPLFLSLFCVTAMALNTGPGDGQCAYRDFSSTNAPGAFGSANSEITFPSAIANIRGAEFDNNTAFELWVSVSTQAANCTGGVANVTIPANASRFLNPGDQKFGSHICVRRRDGSTLSTGTFSGCVR